MTTSMIEDRKEIERRKFEYLDHPADIQIHSWGDNLEEAFETCLTAMFGYMTDLATVEEEYEYYWNVKGDDLNNLLFMLLDDALNTFHAEPMFVAKRVQVVNFDRDNLTLEVKGIGESFNLTKHPTEADIKSPTYSNMQINEIDGRCDIFCIVDI
ncbi:unnamed protein product [Caenorhabditis angaria]|uniref:Protein archease-like n=1 Tax=Caenorhabditis angaria TaxID=860376 RepID=A0A9P1I4U0_9PELO|nr:unnamed protein product [Caenorhabditis angaria]